MRATVGQLAVLESEVYQVFSRIKIANGSGTLKDFSTLAGYDWQDGVSYDTDADQPVSQITVRLGRAMTDSLSIAPLRTDTAINRLDDTVTYSPAVDVGRLIVWEVATLAVGSAPIEADWEEMFRGTVDSIDWSSDPVTLICRDEGGEVVDRRIETLDIYPAGSPLEDVMQAVFDNVFNKVGDTVPTLYVPVSPLMTIGEKDYRPDRQSCMDVQQVLAGLRGWDFRWKWDSGTSSFRPTLYEPPRTKTVADYSFGPGQYIDVNKLSIDRLWVRNAIEVSFTDNATEEGRQDPGYQVEDATSIGRFERQFFRLFEKTDSPIDSLAKATAYGDAILSDLKDPLAEQEIELPFFWPAELGDLYDFEANDVHYNTTQTWAVTGIRHELSRDRYRTFLRVRGKPSGGYLKWFKVPGATENTGVFDLNTTPIVSFRINPATRMMTIVVQGGEGTYECRALARLDRFPTAAELDASSPSAPGQKTGVFTDALEVKNAKRFYVAGRAYNTLGEGSLIALVEGEWLGHGSTPLAEVIIGTVVGGTTNIRIPVAFDEDCAYCEIWIREYTTDPVTYSSVENITNAPFRKLSLGSDAMVANQYVDVVVPIAGPLHYIVATFVPYDALDKRGIVKTWKFRGSQINTNPDPNGGGGTNPTTLAGKKLWWKADAIVGLVNDDEVTSFTDSSGDDNHGVSVATSYPLYKTNIQNGLPVVSSDGSNDYIKSSSPLPVASKRAIFLVMKRVGAGGGNFTFRWYLAKENLAANNSASIRDYYTATGLAPNWGIIYADATSGDDKHFVFHGELPALFNGFNILTMLGRSDTDMTLRLNGAEVEASFDPSTEFFESGYLYLFTRDSGAGFTEMYAGEVLVLDGDEVDDDDVIVGVETYLENRWRSGDGGGGTSNPGPTPDPFPLVTFVSSTPNSITVDVTMPATAPDTIRIFHGAVEGATRMDEVAVTVLGGAVQTVTIEGLEPDTAYYLYFVALLDLVGSSPYGLLANTSGSGGTLDTPDITGLVTSYSAGSQDMYVAFDQGANNPSDTLYFVETSETIGGPYTARGSGSFNGTNVTVTFPYPQILGSAYSLYMRIWGQRAGWTTSDRTAEFSQSIPGAF